MDVTAGAKEEKSTCCGELLVKAEVTGIVEGVIWMPFHYAESPTNLLTNGALDPVCGITELKVCAERIEAARAPRTSHSPHRADRRRVLAGFSSSCAGPAQ